jgi:hypothetical protein
LSIKLNLNKNIFLTAHEPIGTEVSIKNSKHSLKGEKILNKNNFNLQKLFTTAAFVALGLFTFYAFGADEKDMVEKLGDTAKTLLTGKGALIIDAIIIGASGFGAATLRSPAPIIFGLISVGLFHVAIKWITGA